MRTLQLKSPFDIDSQIRTLKAVAQNQRAIRENLWETVGGVAIRDELFREQAKPIVAPLERAIRETRPAPAPAQVALPPPPPTQAPPTPPPPPTPGTVPLPQTPSLTPRTIIRDMPVAPTQSATDFLDQLKRMAPGYTRDNTAISLVTSPASGELVIRNQPVNYSLSPLEIEGFPVTPDLAMLLIGGGGGKWPTGFLQSVSKEAIAAYRTILANVGLDIDQFRSRKATSLRGITGKALAVKPVKPRQPPKSQAGRILPDGTFGQYKADLNLLRGSRILVLTDPKTGQVVYRQSTSPGLAHLLLNRATKSQAGKGLFRPGDVADWNRLREFAKAPVGRKNTKRRLAEDPGTASAVFIPDDTAAMEQRLAVLRGALEAGSVSKANVNEALALADRLLKKRELSRKEHEAIVRQFLDHAAKTAPA